MAEADAEERPLSEQRTQRFDGLREIGRVSRPGGDEDRLRLVQHNLLRRRIVRHDGDANPKGLEVAQDGALDAAVDQHHARRIGRPLPALRARRNAGHEVFGRSAARERRQARFGGGKRRIPHRERGPDRPMLA